MADEEPKPNETRIAELEAKAVAEATASADESFKPSPSLLNAPSPEALLQQVDGPSLEGYNGKESVYVGKSVPVALRAKMEIPINVSAPGSIVEYAIESKTYDICFGVTAEREEGITVVRATDRVDAHLSPVTGKFLVGTVPCLLKFELDNEYSWFREKLLSYRITVTPPSVETLLAGRSRRAKACQKAVVEDLESAEQRLDAATSQRTSLDSEIEKLEKDLEEKKKMLEVVAKEETWLRERMELRTKQRDLLQQRIDDCGTHAEEKKSS